jgi:hypothetical protein
MRIAARRRPERCRRAGKSGLGQNSFLVVVRSIRDAELDRNDVAPERPRSAAEIPRAPVRFIDATAKR